MLFTNCSVLLFQVPNTGSTKSCHRCRGTGGMTCRDCNGKGWSRCLNCHGDGWLHDSGGHRERCFYCQVRHGSSGFVVVICCNLFFKPGTLQFLGSMKARGAFLISNSGNINIVDTFGRIFCSKCLANSGNHLKDLKRFLPGEGIN